MTITVATQKEVNTPADLPEKGEANVFYNVKSTGQMFHYVNGKYAEMIFDRSPPTPEEMVSIEILRLRREIADMKKSDDDTKAALGIIAAANRRVGYAAIILFVLWLNGFRYIETKWEMFFSLFGYTVYLSLIRTVDWFVYNFGALFGAITDYLNRTGGSGI